MSGWATVIDTKTAAGAWVACAPDGKETAFGSDSTGGLTVFKDIFDDTKIQFAAIRVCCVNADEKGDSISGTHPKIVRVNWVGTKVPAMQKMRALQSMQIFAEQWNGISVEIVASDIDSISMKIIGVQLLRCGGHHKPTHFDFGDDKISVSDCT